MLSCKENVLVGDVYFDMYNLIPFIKKDNPAYGMTVSQIYNYLFKKYIHLKQDVEVEIQGFYNSWLRDNGPLLAVHVCSPEKNRVFQIKSRRKQRYQYHSKSYKNSKKDAKQEKVKVPRFGRKRKIMQPNKPYHDAIKKYIDKYDVKTIFLATNSEEILKEYREKYGSMVVSTECSRLSGEKENEYLDSYIVKRRRGIEILKDTFLAAKCDFFVGNDFSSLSHAVTFVRDWPDENVKLLYWEYRHRKYPINAEVIAPRDRRGIFGKIENWLEKRSDSSS